MFVAGMYKIRMYSVCVGAMLYCFTLYIKAGSKYIML